MRKSLIKDIVFLLIIFITLVLVSFGLSIFVIKNIWCAGESLDKAIGYFGALGFPIVLFYWEWRKNRDYKNRRVAAILLCKNIMKQAISQTIDSIESNKIQIPNYSMIAHMKNIHETTQFNMACNEYLTSDVRKICINRELLASVINGLFYTLGLLCRLVPLNINVIAGGNVGTLEEIIEALSKFMKRLDTDEFDVKIYQNIKGSIFDENLE